MTTARTKRKPNKILWPLAALGALLLFNFCVTPGFFHIEIKDGRLYGSLVDILNRGAPVMMLSLGMTLVIATGGVDLSVGAVMAIAGSLAALFASNTEIYGLAIILGIVLAMSAFAGALNGVLVSFLEIQPIVATLILMVSGRGIAQLMTQGQIITFRHEGLAFIGGGYLGGFPFSVFVVALSLCVTVAMTRWTAAGLFIESVGENETASRYVGIHTHKVKMLVYTFSGLCAGVAGLIVASDIRASDANNAGLYLELDAIFAVVIGGTALTGGRFYLVGSLIGALIIQTLTTMILTRGVPVEYTLVVKAIVVLVVCLLQSEDFRRILLGRRRV